MNLTVTGGAIFPVYRLGCAGGIGRKKRLKQPAGGCQQMLDPGARQGRAADGGKPPRYCLAGGGFAGGWGPILNDFPAIFEEAEFGLAW